MEWLAKNWFWVLIGLAFVGMHLFGHRGHGRRGSHSGDGGHGCCGGGHQRDKVSNKGASDKADGCCGGGHSRQKSSDKDTSDKPQGHHH